PTGRIGWNRIGVRPSTSIASSRARSPPSCRVNSRQNMSLSSISRPPVRLAPPCRRRCLHWPTRVLSEWGFAALSDAVIIVDEALTASLLGCCQRKGKYSMGREAYRSGVQATDLQSVAGILAGIIGTESVLIEAVAESALAAWCRRRKPSSRYSGRVGSDF